MTLFPLLGLKLPLCNARCVPANGDKQGIWKQLACAWYLGLVLCSLACAVQDQWILVPLLATRQQKWWEVFFFIPSFEVSVADLACEQTPLSAAETIS